MRRAVIATCIVLAACGAPKAPVVAPAHAATPKAVTPPPPPVSFSGNFTQGGVVFGAAEPGSTATLEGKKLWVTPDGRFLIGFGRDDTAPASLVITRPDGTTIEKTLEIASREFHVERVNGLPPSTVELPPELQARRDKELARIGAAKTEKSWRKGWQESFIWPAKGRISGVYGSQRILNGEPKNPHWGVDVAAPVGDQVVAPASGRVVLAAPDMLLEGGLIMIEHGYGLSSTFLHLSRVLVKEGDEVKQGDPIGEVGATGRASGPHLDWRMQWWDVRIDPQLLVSTPYPCGESAC